MNNSLKLISPKCMEHNLPKAMTTHSVRFIEYSKNVQIPIKQGYNLLNEFLIFFTIERNFLHFLNFLYYLFLIYIWNVNFKDITIYETYLSRLLKPRDNAKQYWCTKTNLLSTLFTKAYCASDMTDSEETLHIVSHLSCVVIKRC